MREIQIAYRGMDGGIYFFTMLAANTLEARNLITPSGIVIVDVRLTQPEEEEEIIGWEPDPEEFEGLEEDYDYAADDRNFDAWREIGYR